jgi:histidine triad (HIT) family protein
MGCLFCKIVAREIPSQIVFENDHVLSFKDVNPQAPTHALVIPKRHLTGIFDATDADKEMLAELLMAGRHVAGELGLAEKGYRLVINQGQDGGQSVLHLHLHVLGGRPMGWPPG